MAASTTLKLPERLKRRIAPLARSVGKTPHAWMVEALETHTALAEKRRTFVADALAADEVEGVGEEDLDARDDAAVGLGGEGGGEKNFNLDQIMAGNLDPLIEALLELDKQQRLESL